MKAMADELSSLQEELEKEKAGKLKAEQLIREKAELLEKERNEAKQRQIALDAKKEGA